MYTCTVMLHKVIEVPILYIIYRSYSNEICRMALSLHFPGLETYFFSNLQNFASDLI